MIHEIVFSDFSVFRQLQTWKGIQWSHHALRWILFALHWFCGSNSKSDFQLDQYFHSIWVSEFLKFILSNQLLFFQSLNGKINIPWNLIHSSQATLDEGYLKYLRYHNHFYNLCWTNSLFTCCWYNFFVKGLMYLIFTLLLQFW